MRFRTLFAFFVIQAARKFAPIWGSEWAMDEKYEYVEMSNAQEVRIMWEGDKRVPQNPHCLVLVLAGLRVKYVVDQEIVM